MYPSVSRAFLNACALSQFARRAVTWALRSRALMALRSACCHSAWLVSALGGSGCRSRSRLACLPGDVIVSEFGFEALACAFVGEVVPAVVFQSHGVDVGSLPDGVDVLTAALFVQHDGARLALKAKLFFQDIDGAPPLIGGHGVLLGGVDVGVVFDTTVRAIS
jgi:hypothetical protein